MASSGGVVAGAGPAATAAAVARHTWETRNNMVTCDDHWVADKERMEALFSKRPRPWQATPRYFQRLYMSSLCALKILLHAKTGKGKRGAITTDKNNWIEVMGLLQGHFYDETLVATDSFALPVDASEVECTMNDQSVSYMIAHLEYQRALGKVDASGCVGWYHSHPGLSCFLSGIDVNTQQLNQAAQDPWIAVVVDPIRSLATGKMEIRAFRTLPVGAAGATSSSTSFDTSAVPAEKIAELGVHFAKYYEVPITFFRSHTDAEQLDVLWTKYWATLLSSSPASGTRASTRLEVASLTQKIAGAKLSNAASETTASADGGVVGAPQPSPPSQERRRDLERPSRTWLGNAQGIADEMLEGMLMSAVKRQVFGAPVS